MKTAASFAPADDGSDDNEGDNPSARGGAAAPTPARSSAPGGAADREPPGPSTPMMRQYRRIRGELPADVLLLFRLGDFYELFGEDARVASGLLNLALTRRHELPMCGVPFHAADGYVAKLIAAGHRVAVCDQKGEVRPGQLVEREVSRILSAGTTTDLQHLDAGRNNYLAAAWAHRGGVGFAFLDLTTGEFAATELSGVPALLDELARVAPAELLTADEPAQGEAFADLADTRSYDPHAFAPDAAAHLLREHFKVQSLDGFGCAGLPRAVAAAGAILHYLRHEMRRPVEHVTALRTYRPEQYLVLDATTQAHLELVQTRTGEGTSLLRALDRTVSPLGARQLRHWLLYPRRDLPTLWARQQLIADLLAAPEALRRLRETMGAVRDLERAVGRLSQAGGNARDLVALRDSLRAVPAIAAALRALPAAPVPAEAAAAVQGAAADADPADADAVDGAEAEAGADLRPGLAGRLHPLPGLVEELTRAVAAEPPATLREGGLFRDGYHEELDALRRAAREGHGWIAALQDREIQRTGIKSLKVRYNSVFGYYIEVTRSNLAAVPADYHRKQTTANGERYVTPELKEIEARLLGAEERARQLESDLFQELRVRVLRDTRALQQTAAALGELDALGSLAEVARQFGYCRPRLRAEGPLRIRDGQHPVLAQRLAAGAGGATAARFVPNDLCLDGEEQRLIVLTGPNMGGKSTYLRQAALLVLLAHVGSYLPAAEAEISLVDRIFTRVGASDDPGRGQSTFLVEMNETANIVHHATARSLVILDEIGRGTSTYDGLAIAWSVAEHLLTQVGARTLFATHYHELTELARTAPGARNYTVAVREWNDEIVFLHRIVPGAADRSYGLQVARLAGMPGPILERAKEILGRLEATDLPAARREKVAAAAAAAGNGRPRRRGEGGGAAAPASAPGEGGVAEDRPQLSLF